MKQTILISLFFLFTFSTKENLAQINLVPDSSFEIYNNCSWGIDYILWPTYSLTYWKRPNMSSPDNYNSCAGNIIYGMPQNMYGYQQAKTGDGYVHIAIWEEDIFNYREYVQTRLTSPLLADRKYCVSFYLSLSDSAVFASDDFGAYFSDTAIFSNNVTQFNNIPQVHNSGGNIIDDKENWVNISGSFVAHGGEQYITLGNFKDDVNTNLILQPYGSSSIIKWCSYYLDDVSVYLCDTLPTDTTITDDIFIPNIFSPNGDLNNDVLYVRSHNIKTMDFCIYNRWGEKVFETKDINKGWDGTYKNSKCNEGVFVWYLNATLKDDKPIIKKGNITLIR